MSGSGLLALEDVSKRFRRSSHPARSLKELLVRSLSRRPPLESFWALREITLALAPGECLGIVGGNGSGKTTLLKLAAGVLSPSSGTVRREGRVASLIDLGAGLQPELTGRENLRLGGVVAGLTAAAVERRLGAIADFSGLETFLDTPVRCYSTGMAMRLAFSLAVHTDPDILLVDDVLGVGDEAFRKRALGHLGELRRNGATLLVVGHQLAEMTRWCDRVAWLDRGRLALLGSPQQAINAYLVAAGDPAGPARASPGSGTAVRIEGVSITPGEDALSPAGSGTIVIELELKQPIAGAIVGVGIHREAGDCCYAINTHLDGLALPPGPGRYRVALTVDPLSLLAGRYYVNVNVTGPDQRQLDFRLAAATFAVGPETGELGVARLPHRWSVERL